MRGDISDEQVALDNCSVPQKDSAISQKRKHIDEGQETVPIQTSRRKQKSAATISKALLTISTEEIQYMLSKSPISQIPLLGNLLSDAVQTSHHWRMERSLEEPTTDCLTTMIPKDPTQDISITLWVGPETGDQMTNIFMLRPTWSSLPSHLCNLETLGNTILPFFGGVFVFPVWFAVIRCIGIIDRDQCTSACYSSVVIYRVECVQY